MSLDIYQDDGNQIQRIRRSPHQAGQELENISFRQFQLDLENGSNTDFLQKRIGLRYSNDGGFTWSDYIYIDLTNKLYKC